MRESEVEKYLVTVVKSLGGDCRKVKWIGRRGAPDRVVMLPVPLHFWANEIRDAGKVLGATHWSTPLADALPKLSRTFWVETKRSGKGATFPANAHERQQAREHARMRKSGQQVVVLDSIGAIDKWAASL